MIFLADQKSIKNKRMSQVKRVRNIKPKTEPTINVLKIKSEVNLSQNDDGFQHGVASVPAYEQNQTSAETEVIDDILYEYSVEMRYFKEVIDKLKGNIQHIEAFYSQMDQKMTGLASLENISVNLLVFHLFFNKVWNISKHFIINF